MSADVDLRKGAVVLRLAVVGTLGNGAANALFAFMFFTSLFVISFLLFAYKCVLFFCN